MLYKQQNFHSSKSLIEYFHDFGRERDEQYFTDFAREMELYRGGQKWVKSYLYLPTVVFITNSCLDALYSNSLLYTFAYLCNSTSYGFRKFLPCDLSKVVSLTSMKSLPKMEY